MTALILGERTLAATDAALLRRLGPSGPAAAIDELLAEADVLAPGEPHPQLVTMYARIDVDDCTTHQRMSLVLCHPGESSPATGRISVLSPIGLALIGLRLHDTAHWTSPNGEASAATVVAVSAPD